MDFASYDELLKQVDILKLENSDLRKELAVNCNYLRKLENEASTMKEVLTIRMDGESEQVTTGNATEEVPDNHHLKSQCNENELSDHNPGSIQAQIAHLERERTRILQDIEFEEKEKQWFLTCMERINQQLFQLSHTNGFSTQADNTLKQQLERDAECLRETMQQKLGTRSEMHRREEARIHSVCLIEKEIEKLFQQQQEDSSKYLSGYSDQNQLNEKSMIDMSEEERFKQSSSEDMKMSSKMTTSATQTMEVFSSDVTSPPPINDQDFSNLASIYHGTWPVDKVLWHSGPSSLGDPKSIHSFNNQDASSVGSFKSSSGSGNAYCARSSNQQQLGTKVEMVYSLLSMLGSHDKDDMSRKLLNMSGSVDSCIAMRQSGCLPLLVELLHSDKDGETEQKHPSRETRRRAGQALHNIVHSHPDDKRGRREARVLRLLEQIREYCGLLRDSDSGSEDEQASPETVNSDTHPVPAMAMLMKLSFDEEHRHAMCQLGGLQAIAELLQVDYETHGNLNDQYCITLRRYAGMALTNLTFGDGTNKALLCSMRSFMRALVAQLHSPSEDLRQVIASVLRNLSWRADQASKKTLREVGAVATLMRAAMEAKKEPTLKSILSALWNLSAHCSMNKADICSVDGALAFLVNTLTYKSPSNTHAIVENGGGILRNISSHIAVREDYRAMLRLHNCLQILLKHLRSPSLTIVSNACGTLWNLSARCSEDQQNLWDMGAVGMLRNLVHSKHKMISMGSSAALKNLLSSKPGGLASNADKHSKSNAPSLLVRKQKALEAELDQNLSETCENLDSPKTSPTHHRSEGDSKLGGSRGIQYMANQVQARGRVATSSNQLHGRMYHSVGGQLPQRNVSRSESKDSIISTQSDSSHDRLHNLNILLRHRQRPGVCHEESPDSVSAAPDVLESRIQYVMQEVTRQIALENDIIKNDCVSKGSCYLKSSALLKVGEDFSLPSSSASKHSRNAPNAKAYDEYSNLSSMMDNLNLEDNVDNYQHTDYSTKYSDEPSCSTGCSQLREESCNAPIISKMNNHTSEKRQSNIEDGSLVFGKSCMKHSNVDWQGSNGRNAKYKLNSEPALLYGSYTETDLDSHDQTTNYSLKYTEDTDMTDTFRAPAPQEATPYFGHEYGSKSPLFHDDTLMTYCTEGTPLNFSTAASLTDLRDLKDGTGVEEDGAVNKLEDGNGKDVQDTKDRINGHDEMPSANNGCKVEHEPESMKMSHAGTIHSNFKNNKNYSCEREILQSCCDGSNNVIGLQENCVQSVKERQGDEDMSEKSCPVVDRHDAIKSSNGEPDVRSSHGSEVKTVTFGDDRYAEETPLMFSRCSSLGSLSSFDQHSIHDDRSSVVSDFSRRASEVVSPSDLPDSPSQTLPPSPRPHGAPPVAFVSRIPRETSSHSKIARPFPLKKNMASEAKKSVFEDSSKVFFVEGTPHQFSKATSLSSLPSCDEPLDNPSDAMLESSTEVDDSKPKLLDSPLSDDFQDGDKTSPSDEHSEENAEKLVSAEISENEDNGEDILAACINSAMPNNTREIKLKHNNTKLYSKVNILNSGSRMRGSCIPVKANNLSLGCMPCPAQGSSASGISSAAAAAVVLHKQNNQFFGLSSVNNISPSVVNKCSSRSSECSDNFCRGESSSDTSSVFDEDPDKILAQCIRSGMPKATSLSSGGKHAGNLLEHKSDENATVFQKDRYNKIQIDRVFLQAATHPHQIVTPTQNPESLLTTDELRVYADEGPPISNATSLSSLTIDSNECLTGKVKNVVLNDVTSEYGNDELKHYNCENTPSWMSRGSSLSSLNIVHTEESRKPDDVDGGDQRHQRLVEDTPACFSRNSSLSSLSIESLCIEPSALEEALLEECISSGMPKGKAFDVRHDRHKSPHGSKLPISRSVSKTACVTRKFVLPKLEECGLVANGGGMVASIKNVEQTTGSSSKNEMSAAAVFVNDFDNMTAENSKRASTNFFDMDTRRDAGSDNRELHLHQHNADGFFMEDTDPKCDVRVLNNDLTLNELCGPLQQNEEQCSSTETQSSLEPGALLIQLEATKVVSEVQNEMQQSLVSQSSDLIDNVNPPSVMGDVLSSSMVSSGTSDNVSHQGSLENKDLAALCDSFQTSKGRCVSSQRSKPVPELVMRALAEGTASSKPPSMTCSFESLSVRSSTTGGIDSVKPPSIMEDLDMASSTYSVCSIVSEVADTKSETFSTDGSLGSDVFRCLKPAIAMAELYARDCNIGMGVRSCCQSVSEIIDNVNPPSTLMEITDTMNEFTEAATDTLENNNDTDVEDDLPADPEPLQARKETLPAFVMQDHKDDAKVVDCSWNTTMTDVENNNEEAVDGGQDPANLDLTDDLNITPEEILVLREDARLVLSTLNEIQLQEFSAEDALCDEMLIECETLSLVSNESDSSYSTSEARDGAQNPPKLQQKPRIVKPINRDGIRQQLQQKDEKSIPKPIRGRRKALYPRQQIISSFSNSRFYTSKTKEMTVKPTRTSALRATQSQQKVTAGNRLPPTDCTPIGSPPVRKPNFRSSTFVQSSGDNNTKIVRPVTRPWNRGHSEVVSNGSISDEFTGTNSTSAVDEDERPRPPIKQGTFTKEKPLNNVPPKISPNKTRIPMLGGNLPLEGPRSSTPRSKDEHLTGRGLASHSKQVPAKNLDENKSARSPSNTERRLPPANNRALSRRGQSASPISHGLSNSASSPRGISEVRNSPSTQSLGSATNGASKRNAVPRNGKLNSLVGSFDGTKRSSSNGSICSNSSSSTSNSKKSSVFGTSERREVQSKISSFWRNDGGANKRSTNQCEPKSQTPREGLSRSSTYEKIPSFECSQLPRHDVDSESPFVDDVATEEKEEDHQSGGKLTFVKKGTRALAEARLQKWLARKARLAGKNNATTTEECNGTDGSSDVSLNGSLDDNTGDFSSFSTTQQGSFHPSLPVVTTTTESPKSPASAIVAPFNYTPSRQLIQAAVPRCGGRFQQKSLIPTLSHVSVSPRQRDFTKSDETKKDDNDCKHPCLVTTV